MLSIFCGIIGCMITSYTTVDASIFNRPNTDSSRGNSLADLSMRDKRGAWWSAGLGFQSNGGALTDRYAILLGWEFRFENPEVLSFPIELHWWRQRRAQNNTPYSITFQNPLSLSLNAKIRIPITAITLSIQGGAGVGHAVGPILYHYSVALEYALTEDVGYSIHFRRTSYETGYPFFLLVMNIKN